MSNYGIYYHAAMTHWAVLQQQRMQQWQANLHQALHETEEAARKASAALPHDLFAAGVLARAAQRRAAGMGPQLFHDFQAKRAWTAATSAIEAASRAAAGDRAVHENVEGYLNRMDRLAGFQNRIGQDPMRFLADEENRLSVVPGGVIRIVLGIVFIVGGMLTLGSKTGAFFMLGGVIGVSLLAFGIGARNKRLAAQARYDEAKRVVEEARAFHSSPDGLGWLQGAWARHRLLFEEPPPLHAQAAFAQTGGAGGFYVERQVERQIVVTRCRYCRKNTPVDRPTCEHCGAAGFGS